MKISAHNIHASCSVPTSFLDPLSRAVRDVLSPRRVRRVAGALAVGLAVGSGVVGADPFPPVFPLAKLFPARGGDGRAGFVLTGIDAGDRSGNSVSAAGDVNGDGIGDLIVGADRADPRGIADAGESYVVFGRNTAQVGNFPAVLPFSSLLPGAGGDGSAGFVLTGINADDNSARSVSSAGDVNGDGIDDLIIGAPGVVGRGCSHHCGASYVVFGRNTAQVGNFPAVLPLVTLASGDGSAGFVLSAVANADKSMGWSVSGAGDVSGDGIDDLIVGAPSTSTGDYGYECGRTFVVFGRNTSQGGNFPAVLPVETLLPALGGDGSAGFTLLGDQYNNDYTNSGYSVSAAGDVNGDGIGDLIVGAPDYNRAGHVYVVFGRNTTRGRGFPAVLHLNHVGVGDGKFGFMVLGINGADRAGGSVSAAGDLNGDGIDDLIIGAPHGVTANLEYGGEAYVLFGRDTLRVGRFPPLFEMSSLLPDAGGDGSAGFVLLPFAEEGQVGSSVSAAGDVNGDGIDDILIGAPGISAGQSYVIYGRNTAQTGNFPPLFELSSLLPGDGGDGSAGFALNGIAQDDLSGYSASDAGDINGDGIDDIIIGARGASPGGRSSAGESYVVFGRPASQSVDAIRLSIQISGETPR